jgi:6-phosphogluconolactonase
MNAITRLIVGASMLLAGNAFADDRHIAYVGTYTSGDSKGVYGLRIAPDGKVETLGLLAEVPNPSFVATDDRHQFLYALSEKTAPKDPTGMLSSYAIGSDGRLRFLNRVPANGTVTGHLAVDHTGRWLIAANYGSGSVAVFALKPDGSIGAMSDFKQHAGSSVDPKRQMGPHPHEAVLSADNRFLFVPDLGLDKIFIYRLDATAGKITPNMQADAGVPPGFGPRHMLFDHHERFAYVLGEMGSKVVVMSYDKGNGKLMPVQTIATLPEGFHGENNSAELALSADGRFLYATNRGHDSITQFAIDAATGELAVVSHTPSCATLPRNLLPTTDGKELLAA